VVICLERGADLNMAQLMPLPLTVSRFSKIQTGFTFLVQAGPGSPRKRAVKRVCGCVCKLTENNVNHGAYLGRRRRSWLDGADGGGGARRGRRGRLRGRRGLAVVPECGKDGRQVPAKRRRQAWDPRRRRRRRRRRQRRRRLRDLVRLRGRRSVDHFVGRLAGHIRVCAQHATSYHRPVGRGCVACVRTPK